MHGMILVGNYYLDPLDAYGATTGLIGPINTTSLIIDHGSAEQRPIVSMRKPGISDVVDVTTTNGPISVSIAVDDQPKEILELLLSAYAAPFAYDGEPDPQNVILIPGRWTKLPRRLLLPAEVSVAPADNQALPFSSSSDYQIDSVAGLLMATVGGAISEPTQCVVTYQNTAYTGIQYSAGAAPSRRCAILMDGKNQANGKMCRVEIDSAHLSTEGEFNPAGNEFIVTALKGVLSRVQGQDSPYRYYEYD